MWPLGSEFRIGLHKELIVRLAFTWRSTLAEYYLGNNQKRRIEQLEYHAMMSRLSHDPASYDIAWRSLTGAAPAMPLLQPGQLLPQSVFNPSSVYGNVAHSGQYAHDLSSMRSGTNRKRRSTGMNRNPPSSSGTLLSMEHKEPLARARQSNSVPEGVSSAVIESSKCFL